MVARSAWRITLPIVALVCASVATASVELAYNPYALYRPMRIKAVCCSEASPNPRGGEFEPSMADDQVYAEAVHDDGQMDQAAYREDEASETVVVARSG